ncbi:unnamed protein product [Darwinula stevensoni]|uniref:Ig-like domain-containing protein n=1 Tax=Darwinula stevensoni TaxID=69355 RepID=A0A7R9FPW9_9CRUS|nr:unnamed protein product [Darwinula stevensoni]CAG0898593.1 unnamed protein product [Darwinula stevensoni]
MHRWALALLLGPGLLALVAAKRSHRTWNVGDLAQIQPRDGIEGGYGEFVFESGENITFVCTLTDAGLNESISVSQLRFRIPTDEVLKPNFTSSDTTVSLTIINAAAEDSGRYDCGNVSSNGTFSMLHTVPLEIGFPPMGPKSWRCWSKELELLHCVWSKEDNPVTTYYAFFVQTEGSVAECLPPKPNAEECEAGKGQSPPYRPTEEEVDIVVRAHNLLHNETFTYFFDHYRNIKIVELKDVDVKTIDAETLNVTWDLPSDLQLYNVSIVHNIQWVPRPWAEELHFVSVEGREIPTKNVIRPTSVSDTSAVFKNLSTKSLYKFYIVSSNEMGKAPQKSIIDVDKEKNRIPCPTILNEILTDDGRFLLEWKAPGEGTTTNYTVFWCSSPPAWPNCDSDIDWDVVPKSNTTFELNSTESLKFAVSANGEFGHSGMGWEKIEYGPDSGLNLPISVLVITALIAVALVTSIVLGGKRLWKHFHKMGDIHVTLPSAFSDNNLNKPGDHSNQGFLYETDSVSMNQTITGFQVVKLNHKEDGESDKPKSTVLVRTNSLPDLGRDKPTPKDFLLQLHRRRSTKTEIIADSEGYSMEPLIRSTKTGIIADTALAYFQIGIQEEETLPDTKGSTLGSPPTKTRGPVEGYQKLQDPWKDSGYWIVCERDLCLAPNEGRSQYICIDLEDGEKAPDDDHDDDSRILDSDYDESLVDNGELMKKLGIVGMETQSEGLSPGYVQASVLSTRGARTMCLSLSYEHGEASEEQPGEFLQVSCIFEGESIPS